MFQLSWSRYKKKYEEGPPLAPTPVGGKITSASFLIWEEHCIECAPPDCYGSCKLYIPRSDQKCARFVDGIVPVTNCEGGDGCAVRIKFRKWAKLESRISTPLKVLRLGDLRRLNAILNKIERITVAAQDSLFKLDRKKRLSGALTWLLSKSYKYLSKLGTSEGNNGLLFQFYTASESKTGFQIEISDKFGCRFRRRFTVVAGWNTELIPEHELPKELCDPALIRIWNEGDTDLDVTITWLHFVKFEESNETVVRKQETTTEKNLKIDRSATVKCVVFDLDNTLWRGVIGDDSVEDVQANSDVIQFIYELDKRGIICSVASKNEFGPAWKMITLLGLDQHLLFPRINWSPKSENIRSIAAEMNISLESIVFIDDSPFERLQVTQEIPVVTAYDVVDVPKLLEKTEFNAPITEQSAGRRLAYIAENKRRRVFSGGHSDIDTFLKECEMTLSIEPAINKIDRCHELVQRTNQFTISGKKFDIESFRTICARKNALCFAVSDKFGDYGTVGFLLAEVDEKCCTILEFVMSCRIAEKKVEETLLNWLALSLAPGKQIAFEVRKTGRNQPIIKKLTAIGFHMKLLDSDLMVFKLDNTGTLRDPKIMEVQARIGQ